MKVLVALAIIVMGLAMLGLAMGFALGATRRTRASEAPRPPLSPPVYAIPAMPPRRDPESPRGMWAGAVTSTVLGIGALVGAAIVLISIMAAPTHMLQTPVQAGGLQRDDSPGTRQLIDGQRDRLKVAGMPNPLIAFYHKPSAANLIVLFIGSSGHMDAPAARLKEFFTESSDREPTEYPAGHLKGTVMCLDQLNTDQSMATCGWADESTLGVITVSEGNAEYVAGLLLSMRDDMEKKA